MPVCDVAGERVGKLVVQHAHKSRSHAGQPGDGNAQLSIIHCRGPCRGLGYIKESLFRIKGNRDVARGCTQVALKRAVVLFEHRKNVSAETVRRL